MAANLPRERLPAHLSYGVTRDGRVFFIDDRLQTTSWLHPLSGVPIQTGHKQVQGLPRGWEQAVTQEGAIYYIDHNKGTTTFDHPWEKPKHHAPSSPSSPPAYPPSPGSPSDKQIKINSPNKLRPLKAPPAKRDDNAMVTLKGWLYRQESGSWKTWKKRWCVLSNFGLFFYKDDKESHTVGSILLPSYRIEECGPADTSKKFAFKAEHNNMKTYMFASDTQDDRTRWIEALKCAAVLKNPPSKEKETNNNTPLPKLIPKSPFMTWDDDEDEDDDQTPRGLSSWQNMLSKGNDPGPSQPTTQQPHKSPQDVRGAPEGHYPKNDPRFADGDPQQRGNQQGRDDPRRQYPGNHARPQDDPRIVDPRNRYLHDPHHGEDYSPQPNNPRAVPQPQEHRQYSQHQSRPPGPEQHISDPYTHSNTHKDRQRPNGYGDMGNQGQLGQGEQDPYSYSTKHHKHPGNMQQRDARQDPRQDPRQFDSRLDPRHDPRQMEPQQIDPRHDPHQMDPRQIDPRHDPHQMDPRQIDPRHGPHHMDPRQIHPRHDPNQVDPQQMNPRHDPYHMDPHQMDPRHDPHQMDPRQIDPRHDPHQMDPRQIDPRHDPHQMDPRQIDPRQMDPSHDHRQIDPQQDPRYSLSNKDPYVSRKADSMPAQFVRRGEDQSRRRDSLPGHYNKDRSPNSNRGTDISPNSSLDPYSGRKSDSLPGQYTGGRDISPNASNYSDAAYDRYSGQPNIPQQSGRVPDPQDPYSMDQYNPGSRSQDPGPRSHDLGYSEGPNQRLDDREEVMMSHRDVPQHAKYRPSKHDTPSERSSDIEAPRQSEYDGFYSPTRESKQRELANRPLPAIKVSNKTENPPVKLNTHHQREDTDDGYSTLTKYQEQRRKKAQDQLEAQQLGPRSQHDLYDHDQAYPRQQEQPLEVRAPENQNEALHTYVNLPDRASLRDLQDRDVGVEYIEEVPERPPLPTAVRKQIVQEIAQAKTPRTSEELLEAERALETRMQQPSYFDYPTPVFPPKDHPVFDEEAEPASRQHGQRSNNSLPRPWNLPAGDEYTRGGNTGYYDNRVNGSPSRERTVPKQVYAQGHQRQPEGDRRRKDRTTGKPVEEATDTQVRSIWDRPEDGQTETQEKVPSDSLDPKEGSNPRDVEGLPEGNISNNTNRSIEILEKNSDDSVEISSEGHVDRYRSTESQLDRYKSAEGVVYTQVNRQVRREGRDARGTGASKTDSGNRETTRDRSKTLTKQKENHADRKKDGEKDKGSRSQLESTGSGHVISNYANMNPLDMPYEEVHRLEVSSEEDEADMASRRRERRSAFRPLLSKPKGKDTFQRLDRLMGTPPCPPSPAVSETVSKTTLPSGYIQPAYHNDSKQNLFDEEEEEEETMVKKRISMASIASSKGSQFRGHNSISGEGGRRQHGKMDPGPIHTVKEDPDMADEDVIEFRGVPNLAKKYPLSGGRIRMSISAGDLIGKTHDELVLLLIQLRREHADLEKERNFFREKVDQRRASEQNYRRLLQESDGPFDQLTEREHYEFMQLRSQLDDAEKRLEVYRPMVNLVHNMVNMGSLYGGDNFMLASQYRKHLLSPDEFTPPKKMLEFSRKHQEEKIVHGIKEDIKQLSSDEVILEDKLEKLYELDRRMHEQSYHVAQAQEDKDMLEKALQGILRQQDMCRDNIREQDQLIHQQRTIEKEISRVMHQLAKSSGDLEETTAENNMIEHEVALLRSKVTGELSRSKSAPSLSNESLRNKMKMEKDLAQVKNIMAGLNQQGAELSEAMNTLRRSSAGAKFASAFTKVDQNNLPKPAPMSTYFETDLDSAKTTDLSQVQEILISYRDQTPVQTSPTVTVKSQHQPIMSIKTTSSLESSPSRIPAVEDTVDGQWDIEEADDNTKRFFGILPKDKPKTLTVRDVKRQSEQRKEQLKVRKETEEDGGGEPWSYNGVDTEQPAGSNYTQPSINNQGPIYENLPPSHSAPRKTWSSVNALATPGSAPNSRRSSALHLMMPRPFVPFGSQPTSTQTSYSSLNVDNQSKTSGSYRLGQSDDDSIVKATRVIIQPQLDDADTTAMSPTSPPRHGMFSVKRTPRGRYMTISSSQPVKLETTLVQPSTPNTAAGDLIINRSRMDVPDIVQSSQMRDDQTIDTGTIDKEILFVPDKVLIPERYNPESDEEDLTEEDQARRQEKSEKIKKLLAQQSIHSISQPDVSQVAGELHKKVEQEKVKRAELLQVGQELARQVTLKTRQAAAERRKTWSGSPAKSPREREMEYNFLNGHDSEVLGQTRDDLYGQAPLRMQEKLFI
ncbi:uncharacterized protein LOC110453702 isoform X3 [Mizuhopecten yessoensis]|uniref:uncharacterized protein LOC110453702 isoform X3 n=1 Tax=Mizuhopecten yessoensis TaxID=6573 RepID=UPI000B457546|nr:uncharacterized protein LOC110453702 isoform X3 [Mizuhopecten yessoensis]